MVYKFKSGASRHLRDSLLHYLHSDLFGACSSGGGDMNLSLSCHQCSLKQENHKIRALTIYI